MTLDEHLQIEEILAEANAFGLKQEVIHTAAKLAAAPNHGERTYSLHQTIKVQENKIKQ